MTASFFSLKIALTAASPKETTEELCVMVNASSSMVIDMIFMMK